MIHKNESCFLVKYCYWKYKKYGDYVSRSVRFQISFFIAEINGNYIFINFYIFLKNRRMSWKVVDTQCFRRLFGCFVLNIQIILKLILITIFSFCGLLCWVAFCSSRFFCFLGFGNFLFNLFFVFVDFLLCLFFVFWRNLIFCFLTQFNFLFFIFGILKKYFLVL